MASMRQFLHVTAFFVFHLVPYTLCGNLRCLYRPILEKEYEFQPIVTECPRGEVCYKAEGRYGNYSALSASGCMPRRVCGLQHDLSYQGVVYTMSYSCCDRPYCNACVGLFANTLVITVTLVTVAGMVGR
ncbi:protein Bouncer [Hippocampus comes]|uniref:protein Bouncer n=1 Tax=Hippocampus comes TaxID=109280 RepID=UPI00094E1DDC|nr:PREDICTED: sperm acrosome membrane-associated protein 4-like [Hippocampus comes]